MKRNMLLILKLGTPKNGEQYDESTVCMWLDVAAAPKILVEDAAAAAAAAVAGKRLQLEFLVGSVKRSAKKCDWLGSKGTWADHNDCRNLDGPSFDAQLHSVTKDSRDLSSWGN